jgi:hypothetical protein
LALRLSQGHAYVNAEPPLGVQVANQTGDQLVVVGVLLLDLFRDGAESDRYVVSSAVQVSHSRSLDHLS